MVKVKICGITNLKDAEAAVRFGADALGFIFAESPRRVNPKIVREIAEAIGPFTALVGVFVNQTTSAVLETAAACRLDAIQLHGEESPEYCRKLAPYKVIKTFRMGSLFSPKTTKKFSADAFLFETDEAGRGGTGRTWAWEKFDRKKINRPFLVSGGLTPSNVARAVRILKPYAVDVASGVESKPGNKDHELLKSFIYNAKTA